MKVLIAFLIVCFSNGKVFCQEAFPEIGKKCPDFLLSEVYHLGKKSVSSKDFLGKWLVLDFFATGCATCFASFPKINQLQIDFKEQVQFLLVGLDDKTIRNTYENFRLKQDLKLPVAYSKQLPKQWGIEGYPHVVVIDPQGVVRAVTSGIKSEDLKLLLEGADPKLNVSLNIFQRKTKDSIVFKYDANKLVLLNGNGGPDSVVLHRSIIAKYDGLIMPYSGLASLAYNIESIKAQGFYQLYGASLRHLYYNAYFGASLIGMGSPYYGKIGNPVYPELRLADSSLFDTKMKRKSFIYSVTVPPEKASVNYVQNLMRRDLKNYFGYDVTIEDRIMPYWRLVIVDQKKLSQLKTKGGIIEYKRSPGGIHYSNVLIKDVLQAIYYFHQTAPPFFDETGIEWNVDFDMNAVMTDLDDIRKGLQYYGLDLVKGEKPMKIFVIKDPELENDKVPLNID